MNLNTINQTLTTGNHYSKNLKIYKHRYLNEGNFKFSLEEYRIFLLILSNAYKMSKEGMFLVSDVLKREIMISAEEFSKVFNIDLSNCYDILKNSQESLIEKNISIRGIDSKNRTKERITIALCSHTRYKDGRLYVLFSQSIMPYIERLTEKYVSFNISEVSKFRSIYSTRFYEFIAGFKKLGKCRLSIEDLRFVLGVHKDKLLEYSNFKLKALIHAINEINKIHPKLKLELIEIKTGRRVTETEFKFKKSKLKELDDYYTETTSTPSITYQEDVRIRLIKLGVEQKIIKRYSKYLDSTLESAYETIKKVVEARTLKTTPTAYFRYLMEI